MGSSFYSGWQEVRSIMQLFCSNDAVLYKVVEMPKSSQPWLIWLCVCCAVGSGKQRESSLFHAHLPTQPSTPPPVVWISILKIVVLVWRSLLPRQNKNEAVISNPHHPHPPKRCWSCTNFVPSSPVIALLMICPSPGSTCAPPGALSV